MLMAHIAGIPVEETALTMAPVATALGGAMLRTMRRGVAKRPSPLRRRRSWPDDSTIGRGPRP